MNNRPLIFVDQEFAAKVFAPNPKENILLLSMDTPWGDIYKGWDNGQEQEDATIYFVDNDL